MVRSDWCGKWWVDPFSIPIKMMNDAWFHIKTRSKQNVYHCSHHLFQFLFSKDALRLVVLVKHAVILDRLRLTPIFVFVARTNSRWSLALSRHSLGFIRSIRPFYTINQWMDNVKKNNQEMNENCWDLCLFSIL